MFEYSKVKTFNISYLIILIEHLFKSFFEMNVEKYLMLYGSFVSKNIIYVGKIWYFLFIQK